VRDKRSGLKRRTDVKEIAEKVRANGGSLLSATPVNKGGRLKFHVKCNDCSFNWWIAVQKLSTTWCPKCARKQQAIASSYDLGYFWKQRAVAVSLKNIKELSGSWNLFVLLDIDSKKLPLCSRGAIRFTIAGAIIVRLTSILRRSYVARFSRQLSALDSSRAIISTGLGMLAVERCNWTDIRAN
jgi:hypothetical protein